MHLLPVMISSFISSRNPKQGTTTYLMPFGSMPSMSFNLVNKVDLLLAKFETMHNHQCTWVSSNGRFTWKACGQLLYRSYTDPEYKHTISVLRSHCIKGLSHLAGILMIHYILYTQTCIQYIFEMGNMLQQVLSTFSDSAFLLQCCRPLSCKLTLNL